MGLDYIRTFDLYKKVPHDLKKGTVSGAVISLVCVGFTVYLIFAELVLYSKGSLKTSIFVSFSNHEEHLKVMLNLTIVDKFCDDIAVDTKNAHGQHQENIKDIVHKQVQDDCNLSGSITVQKTPGVLIILPHKDDNTNLYEYKVERSKEDLINGTGNTEDEHSQQEPCIHIVKGWTPPEGFKPPNGYKVIKTRKNMMMNHAIHTLEFGEQLPFKKKWNEVLPPESKPFTVLSGTARELPINVSHDYHLKLVPTTFIDQNKRRTDSYQYSYAYQNFIMMTPAGIAPPSIIMRYEVSAMEIKYQYERKPLYHMITMMCAVVGGIVSVAGVIDKILFNAHQLLKHKIEIGKQS